MILLYYPFGAGVLNGIGSQDNSICVLLLKLLDNPGDMSQAGKLWIWFHASSKPRYFAFKPLEKEHLDLPFMTIQVHISVPDTCNHKPHSTAHVICACQ